MRLKQGANFCRGFSGSENYHISRYRDCGLAGHTFVPVTISQIKVGHRVHWSNSTLAGNYPGTNPNCHKCQLGQAKFTDTFCTHLLIFILEVWRLTNSNTLPSPVGGLFGVLLTDHSLSFSFIDLPTFSSLSHC